MTTTVEIFSDFICPWCFVAKPRIKQAIATLSGEMDVQIIWRPFKLNPTMPRECMNRKEYRTRKFGSWEKSLAMDAQVTAAGATDGVPFDFPRVQRTPNTLDAHRLTIFAKRFDKQDEMAEAIFRAYFSEGKDIGGRKALAAIAESLGLDATLASAFLDSLETVPEVETQEARARRLGVQSVPSFVINGKVVTAGAQPTELLVAAFRSGSRIAPPPILHPDEPGNRLQFEELGEGRETIRGKQGRLL